jgi:hypothetical protein
MHGSLSVTPRLFQGIYLLPQAQFEFIQARRLRNPLTLARIQTYQGFAHAALDPLY